MFPNRALPFKLLADTLSLFKCWPGFLKFSVVFNQEQQPLDESILTVARGRFVLRKFFLSSSQKRAFFSLSLSCDYMCYLPSPKWNKRKKWTRLNTWIFFNELPVINPNKEWFVTVNIQLIFQVCLFFHIGLVFEQEVMWKTFLGFFNCLLILNFCLLVSYLR